MSKSKGSLKQAVLAAGLIAGTLDILAAILVNLPRGISPQAILQSVASGLLGREAYAGGAATAVLGLALHYAMMFLIVTVFMLMARRYKAFTRHAFVAGALYGVAVFFVMNAVVLPLSAFPHDISFAPAKLAQGLLIHILLVGLPIALIARRYGVRPAS